MSVTDGRPEGLAEQARTLCPEIGTVVRDRDTILIALRGDLDAERAPDLQEAIDTVLDGTIDRVIFDLSGLGFMDSSGLNVLVTTRARLTGGSVVVREASESVWRLLEVTGLDTLLAEVPLS